MGVPPPGASHPEQREWPRDEAKALHQKDNETKGATVEILRPHAGCILCLGHSDKHHMKLMKLVNHIQQSLLVRQFTSFINPWFIDS